jgi:hypothetical protein
MILPQYPTTVAAPHILTVKEKLWDLGSFGLSNNALETIPGKRLLFLTLPMHTYKTELRDYTGNS